MKTNPDIAIIGAGPAGASCARILAEKGAKVTLFDHRAPWEKPCGGMLGPGGITRNEALSRYTGSITPVTSLHCRSSREQSMILPADPPAAVVDRLELNSFLLQEALSRGAEHVKDKITEFLPAGEGKWQLKGEKSSYNASILIGADGVFSRVRRTLVGNIPREHLSVCCGYTLRGLGSEPEGFLKGGSEQVIQFSDIEGYIWIFPGKKSASAGIGAPALKSSGIELFKKLESYIKTNYPRAGLSSRYSAFIPSVKGSEFYETPCCGKNWLLLGDAAGHIESVTGEGIYYALESGRLAAEAILAEDIQSYDDRWRAEYGEALRRAADFRGKVSHTAEIFGNSVAGAMLYNYFTGDGTE